MLNEEQVQNLFEFCRKKGVRFYDLQCELVDHLSEAIEEKMKNTPMLNFDDALAEVYKGFGIFGFSHVVRDKEVAVGNRNYKKRIQHFKTFFSYPKIALTMMLAVLFSFPIYWFKNIDLGLYYLALVSVTAALGLVLFFMQLFVFKRPKKKLIVLQYTPAFGSLGILLQFPSFYFNFIWRGIDTNDNLWINAILISGCVVLILLALASWQVNKCIYKEAQRQYPLAFE